MLLTLLENTTWLFEASRQVFLGNDQLGRSELFIASSGTIDELLLLMRIRTPVRLHDGITPAEHLKAALTDPNGELHERELLLDATPQQVETEPRVGRYPLLSHHVRVSTLADQDS